MDLLPVCLPVCPSSPALPIASKTLMILQLSSVVWLDRGSVKTATLQLDPVASSPADLQQSYLSYSHIDSVSLGGASVEAPDLCSSHLWRLQPFYNLWMYLLCGLRVSAAASETSGPWEYVKMSIKSDSGKTQTPVYVSDIVCSQQHTLLSEWQPFNDYVC